MKLTRLTSLVCTVAIVFLFAVACSPSTSYAAFPGANGKIAFTAYGYNSNTEIYVVEADGSNQTNLTNHLADDYAPAWSPDATKIAFASNRDGNSEIYVMNADGSNPTRLTFNSASDYNPAWSPDGTKIAFDRSFYDGNILNFEIYVMNADGSNQTRLAINAGSPAWSPDGSKIAFGGDAIYVMNTDGSNPTRLTFAPAGYQHPTWSPDGSKITFASWRDGPSCPCSLEIYTMNADGSNQTRLTFNDAEEREPAWSPDSSKIAFISTRDGSYRIYVMNADGSNQTSLTNPSPFAFDLDWGVSATPQDTTPPRVACSASPNSLWPPNSRLLPVNTTVTVTDSGSGANGFVLLSVTTNEGDPTPTFKDGPSVRLTQVACCELSG